MGAAKGRSGALERVQQVAGTLVPAGTGTVHGRSGSKTLPLPDPSRMGIETGEQWERWRHVETGAVVMLPPGVDIEEVTGDD